MRVNRRYRSYDFQDDILFDKIYLQNGDRSIYSNKYTYSFARANFVSPMIAHKSVA